MLFIADIVGCLPCVTVVNLKVRSGRLIISGLICRGVHWRDQGSAGDSAERGREGPLCGLWIFPAEGSPL